MPNLGWATRTDVIMQVKYSYSKVIIFRILSVVSVFFLVCCKREEEGLYIYFYIMVPGCWDDVAYHLCIFIPMSLLMFQH